MSRWVGEWVCGGAGAGVLVPGCWCSGDRAGAGACAGAGCGVRGAGAVAVVLVRWCWCSGAGGVVLGGRCWRGGDVAPAPAPPPAPSHQHRHRHQHQHWHQHLLRHRSQHQHHRQFRCSGASAALLMRCCSHPRPCPCPGSKNPPEPREKQARIPARRAGHWGRAPVNALRAQVPSTFSLFSTDFCSRGPDKASGRGETAWSLFLLNINKPNDHQKFQNG